MHRAAWLDGEQRVHGPQEWNRRAARLENVRDQDAQAIESDRATEPPPLGDLLAGNEAGASLDLDLSRPTPQLSVVAQPRAVRVERVGTAGDRRQAFVPPERLLSSKLRFLARPILRGFAPGGGTFLRQPFASGRAVDKRDDPRAEVRSAHQPESLVLELHHRPPRASGAVCNAR